MEEPIRDRVDSPAARRIRPTDSGTELETLTQMLDFLRATVVVKADGLSDLQAAAQPVPASELTITGLVKPCSGSPSTALGANEPGSCPAGVESRRRHS